MTRGETEAARLRAHREAFELSMARRIPLSQATFELAKKRWQEAEVRLAQKRCGTRAPAAPVGSARPEQGERELAWWQQ